MLSDAHIVSRLASVEGQLLDTICKPSSLLDFDARWSSFVSDISKALEAELLTPPTLSLVHTLSHKVSDVFQTLLDLESLSDTVLSSLGQEVSTITSGPVVEAEMRKRKKQASPTSSAVSVPAHIKLAHKWLLAHPHDPYPSASVRDELARKTGHPRKDIDNWFVETRRRIGWTEMRKTYFANRRADIVDAAYRAYVNPDPKRPLPYIIHRQFLKVRRHLEDLHASTLSETVLASKLDANFKDLTPELKEQVDSNARWQKLEEKAALSAQSEKAATQNSHHGEDQSCEPMSSTCHPSVNAERSEQFSPSSPLSSEDDYGSDMRSRKRKHRSSETLDVGSVKRLRRGQIGLRHHVTSDPLSTRNVSSDPPSLNWYLDACFPSPAGVEEPDLPSDLELELGNLSSYLRDIYTTPTIQSTSMYSQTLSCTNTGLKHVSDAAVSCDNAFDFRGLCDPPFDQFMHLSGTSSQSLPEFNGGLDPIPSNRPPFLGSSDLDTAIIVDSSFPNLPDTNWLYIPYLDHPHGICEFQDFCDRQSSLPAFETMFKQ